MVVREEEKSTAIEGYKHTDIGLIPLDWTTPKIGDIAKLINGRGFKPFEWRTRGIPIIRIQNLNGSKDFNYFDGNYDPKIEVQDGQLLFAWSGSRGTSFGPHFWHGEKGVLNYHTWKIVPEPGRVNVAFFYHSLRGLTQEIEASAHGASALVHVQKWQIEALSTVLPPLAEQEAIGEALSDADGAIRAVERLLAKKRAVKQATLQTLLSGQTRLPGFEGEWTTMQLGELCDSITDGTHYTPKYVANGIPFYSVENVTRDDFENVKFISKREHEKLVQRCKPEKGDILLTRIGSIGDTKLITWEVDASIYVSLALLKPNKRVLPEYLFAYTQTSRFVKSLEDRSLLNAIPKKVNMQDIGRTEILVPDFSEQTAIAIVVSDLGAEIDALGLRLSKLRAIKQGMMQELLTGRTRLV